MNTQIQITAKTTGTSPRGLRRTTGRLATAAAFAASAAFLPTARAANVSEVPVSLNSTAYVKLDVQGTLKDTLSLSGITAFNGTAQVDFVCVSNRPYTAATTAVSGLPSGSYVHQLSVFNNWDGSRTRSYRVQLAQPDGTTDIYARITCVTVSQDGVNLVDYPDIRDFKDDTSKIAGSYTDDATIADFPVTKLRLRRIDDPYIESDGTSGISTGYRMKGTSRLEVDFAIPDVSDTSEWNECRIFGTDNSTYEPTLQTCLYATYTAANGNTFFRLRAKISASNSQPTKYKPGVDAERHTAIFDLPNAKMVFMTGGVTNSYNYSDGGTDKTVDAGVSFAGQEATLPLSLFGRWGNAQATTFANMAKARIYGVKIYEGDVLVRDFVPCLKDGVACFKDLVNGGFIVGENASAFSADGAVPAYADDGYVSTAANADGGKLYFDTGYKTTDKSAVALDCAFIVNTNLAGAIWHLFQEGSGNIFSFNLNGNNGLRFQADGTYKTDFTTAFKATLYDDKDVRRTFYLYNGGTAAVVTTGHTNQVVTFTQSATFNHSQSLKLASNWAGNNNFAAIKIYGCKIWEDGALVRDFAPYVDNGTPGLRDNITGAFIAASRGSGDTTSALAYGGAIAGEQDAYLQSAGTANISTGYKMNGASRLEVDFALTATDKQQRLFGTDSSETFKTYLYIDGSSNYSMVTPFGQIYTTHAADTIRHTGIIDINHGWAGLVTGTATNWSKTTTTSYAGQEADNALPLFGRGSAYAKERIYSVRIYESDALAHEFVPYSRDGVAGLYDTMTGDVISNGSSFTFGGMGQDHGQLKAYVSPQHATTVSSGKTVALTAYAPGASSYRWLMDGEPVAGGTDGTYNVTWARGGTRTGEGHRHEYQAIAIFDFYGTTRESEPSAAETVTSTFNPFMLIVQ